MKHRANSIVAACFAMCLAALPVSAADQPGDVVTGGHKEVHATIEKIDSGMIFMKVPDQLQTRTLPVTKAERLGLQDLKVGEELSLVIDENNLVIDVHKAGVAGKGHRMLTGRLESADKAGKSIRLATADGLKAFAVDPMAASKVSGLKEKDQVMVEVDEANTVIDIHPEK
jgi:hypothetical protein